MRSKQSANASVAPASGRLSRPTALGIATRDASGRGSRVCLWMTASAVLLSLTLLVATALGQSMTQGIMSPPSTLRPPGLQHVGIRQNLNQQIPPDLAFTDDQGRAVKLGDYFGKKPLILNLVYFTCPMLCGEELNGLESALRVMKFDAGREFDVLTVSFDPKDTPAAAAKKKAEILKRYNHPGADQGWHFLVGNQDSIDKISKAAGFEFEYDQQTQQFAHSTAIMVLTPQGVISQYYYGIEYPPNDLRLALVDASKEKIGNLVDELLLYCYHYDPEKGKYSATIMRILRLAGVATLLCLGTLFVILIRRDPNRRHRHQGALRV